MMPEGREAIELPLIYLIVPVQNDHNNTLSNTFILKDLVKQILTLIITQIVITIF